MEEKWVGLRLEMGVDVEMFQFELASRLEP
jgi:hypothetical protein